eukprot:9329187-Heterocapsa_arctica.AAC.1
MTRVKHDARFFDVIGDGEYSEVGLYTQYCPAFRKLLEQYKTELDLAPIPSVLETLQALCLPLGTSYELQKHEHSRIQKQERAKTEPADDIFARLPNDVQMSFREVDRCEGDNNMQDHSSSNSN